MKNIKKDDNIYLYKVNVNKIYDGKVINVKHYSDSCIWISVEIITEIEDRKRVIDLYLINEFNQNYYVNLCNEIPLYCYIAHKDLNLLIHKVNDELAGAIKFYAETIKSFNENIYEKYINL